MPQNATPNASGTSSPSNSSNIPASQVSSTRWFVAVGKEKQGPFDDVALKSKIANGELDPEQRIWRKGMIQWERSKAIPEVQALREEVARDAQRIENERQALEKLNADVKRWFIAVNKKPTGPFSDNELVKEAAENRLAPRTKLWRKGQEGWVHFSQIAELAGVRERADRMAAEIAPPAIEDDHVAALEPKFVPLAASAAAKSPPPLLAQAAPLNPLFLTKPFRSAVPIRLETVSAAKEACASVARLFSNDPRVESAVESLHSTISRDLMTGNGFGLDKSIEALGAFVKAAMDKMNGTGSSAQADSGASVSPDLSQQALANLRSLHAMAAVQVSNLNRNNLLADRTITSFGIRSRPTWGVAPSF